MKWEGRYKESSLSLRSSIRVNSWPKVKYDQHLLIIWKKKSIFGHSATYLHNLLAGKYRMNNKTPLIKYLKLSLVDLGSLVMYMYVTSNQWMFWNLIWYDTLNHAHLILMMKHSYIVKHELGINSNPHPAIIIQLANIEIMVDFHRKNCSSAPHKCYTVSYVYPIGYC